MISISFAIKLAAEKKNNKNSAVRNKYSLDCYVAATDNFSTSKTPYTNRANREKYAQVIVRESLTLLCCVVTSWIETHSIFEYKKNRGTNHVEEKSKSFVILWIVWTYRGGRVTDIRQVLQVSQVLRPHTDERQTRCIRHSPSREEGLLRSRLQWWEFFFFFQFFQWLSTTSHLGIRNLPK